MDEENRSVRGGLIVQEVEEETVTCPTEDTQIGNGLGSSAATLPGNDPTRYECVEHVEEIQTKENPTGFQVRK